MSNPAAYRCCIAPMLKWTNRHFRYFLRLISPHSRLYTEMITTGALLFGPAEKALAFDSLEQPVAIQLGGENPEDLARCAKLAERAGYQEVNLNIGCPSDRVKSGRFGACLMADPGRVAEGVQAMREAVDLPITLKTRIGIDRHDDYDFLANFIDKTMRAGCETYFIHARKAWLTGLSPKQNRTIPPLCYERVYAIKQAFPHLTLVINGGITEMTAIQNHLQQVDGVMLGRIAYQNPYLLAEVEQMLFDSPALSRVAVVERYLPYIEAQLQQGVSLSLLAKPLLTLFKATPYAKQWRRVIGEEMHKQSGTQFIRQQLSQMV